MLTHLLVLLDTAAPSFCYYPSGPRPGGIMPPAVLAETIAFARRHSLALVLLHGETPLPADCQNLIAAVGHAAIVPAALAGRYPDAVPVLLAGRDDPAAIPGVRKQLILRLPRERLADMAAAAQACLGRCARLNLYPLDIDRYTDHDIALYKRQLGLVADLLAARYRQGDLPEINLISDRMLLSRMNNCDAGAVHLTVAPDGRLHICPGLLAAGSVGSLADGIAIANARLLALENAPICACCDAWHCKRCIYLNNKTTLEWNTPSRQQCLLAHLERDAARLLQQRLADLPAFARQAPIPALDYLDPFSRIIDGGQPHE
jgi:CXXX repeat peptide maturase